MVSYRGRARHESDGTRCAEEYDSMIPSPNSPTGLLPNRWSGGFDGTRHYHWQVLPNEFVFGEGADSLARQWTPRSLIWERSEELVRTLGGDGSQESFDRDRATGGRRALVLRRRGQGLGRIPRVGKRDDHLAKARNTSRSHEEMDLTAAKYTPPTPCKACTMLSLASGTPDRDRGRVHQRSVTTERPACSCAIQVVEYRPRQIPLAVAFQLEIPYGVDGGRSAARLVVPQ